MSRTIALLAAVALLALTGPAAMAITWDYGDPPTGDADEDIDVEITIDGYAQVLWQDLSIVFSDNNDGTGDWWNDTAVEGTAYSALPSGTDEVKASTDPWAGYDDGCWYESRDSARVYVHTNADIDMTVTDSGDLADGGDTIPTWFTVSAFGLGGSAIVGDATYNWNAGLPGAVGTGTFMYESGSDLLHPGTDVGMEYPNQDAIALDGSGTWKADLDAETDATITFVVRIERHGLSDSAGVYTTTIPVAFSASS
jgi:hypothetical protein